MYYTDEQIATLLEDRTPGEWRAYDYEKEFEPDILEADRSGGYWLEGPKYIPYDVSSLFTKQDAAFIVAAPAIIAQQVIRIQKLDGIVKLTNNNTKRRGDRIKELEDTLRQVIPAIDWACQSELAAAKKALDGGA